MVRHALLRPGEQPRQSSPTAATCLGAAGSKSSIGGRLPGGRRRCGEDEGLVFGLGLRLGPVLSLVLGLDYEDLGSDLSWSPGPSSNGDGVLGLVLVTVLGLVETQAQLHCWMASCSPC